MAINKERNVSVQVTFPKEDAEQLSRLQKAFQKEGIKVTKSDILVGALRNYIKLLVVCGSDKEQEDKEVENPQGGNKDA